jgi:tetratricopeptide (TPR) repeat protein
MNGSITARVLSFAAALFMLAPVRAWAEAPAGRPVNDKWALIVGISEFADSSLNLKYSAKDAQDFYNYLVSDGHFAKDHVKLLLNEKATRQQILSEAGDSWLPKVAGTDDLVVIFISSHGSPADENVGGVNYILAHDTSKSNLYASGIAMQDLSQILKDRVRSDRLVLILDACHSGNASPEGKGIFRSGNVNVEDIARGSGKTVMSSSEPSQMSWESKDYPNGVFTHHLVEALRGKGSDTTLGGAFQSMKEKVQEEVLRDRGALQSPVLKGGAGGADLMLAVAPANPAPPPVGLSAAGEPAGEESASAPADKAEVAMLPTAASAESQIRVWETYLESGVKARSEGRYSEAEQLLKEAIQEADKFGSESARYASSINELAELYRIRGQYAEAEPLFRKALAIRERVLGADDPAVAQSLNRLGLLLRNRGKYSEAEPLFRQSLEIWSKKSSEESSDVAQSLNNLAGDLLDKGKYAEAESLCRRSLAISEKLSGPGSVETARSLATLGLLQYKLGRYTEAKKTLLRSIDIMEKVLGPEHPNLVDPINSLAQLNIVQHRYSEAEPLFYRSLAISEKAYGPDHPAVAESLDKLALLYELRLKYSQAEENFKRALEIREKALGPEHPAVAESLTNLAWLSYAQEKYPQADSLYRRAQAISEKALESDNPAVVKTLEYYTHLLRATSRNKQATALQAKIKAMRAKHTLENPNSKLKTDSAILSARAYALTEKHEYDKKKKDD